MFEEIEGRKGFYVAKPSPLNLGYRKKVSFLKDDFTVKYLNKFKDDMEYRFYTKIIEMTDEELILFAVKFLGEDTKYQYYYIYNDETIIGEIYAYSWTEDNDYFFFLYIDEKYRTPENYINAIVEFEEIMFSPFIKARRLYIDTDFLDLDDVLIKSKFKVDTIFYDDRKRYICKEYMHEDMHIESPTLEHEKKFKNYLKYSHYRNYKKFNYKKWLKHVEKNSKNKKVYFLMYYNSDIKDTEIVGVGSVLENWKKVNCIKYKIEKERKQTDFGKYFLEMLFEKLEDKAEFMKLTCNSYDRIKVKEYEEVFKSVIDDEYKKFGKTYFKITIMVE